MIALKKYVNENNIKKVGITRLYKGILTNISTSTNPGPVDIHYLYKFLSEVCGVEVHIINMTSTTHSELYKVVHYSEINLNEYDLLIFQPYYIGVFGGVWEEYQIDYFDKFNREYEGTSMILYNDPNIPWMNPYDIIVNRNKNKVLIDKKIQLISKTQKDVEIFNSKKIIALFVGKNYSKYVDLSKKSKHDVWPENHMKIDLVNYIIFHEFNKKKTTSSLFEIEPSLEKKYDIFYFGSDRKGSRSKKLNMLFKNDKIIKKLWVGYDPGYENTIFHKKQKRNVLHKFANESLCSLVIGDDAHDDNMLTYRVFENALMRCLSMIHLSYDTKRSLFKDEELKKYTYFSNTEELINNIKVLRSDSSLYLRLIEKQYEEVENMGKNFN